jgi:hypothetical protein
MEQIVELLVDYGQNHVYDPLQSVKLETLTPFWVISYIPAHQTFVLS